jgi:hypothetical protein
MLEYPENDGYYFCRLWEYLPVIPALRRLRQKDHKFEAGLGYTMRPYLKKKKNGLEVWFK